MSSEALAEAEETAHCCYINPLKPNDLKKKRRTAQIISRCCILNIYSTNIPTEYFKHAA